MNLISKFKKNNIILGVFFIVFLITNIITLTEGHNWGGDFSQYILHAKNLVSQKNYTDGLIVDHWSICAPGFPLLIAPAIKFFGINLKILKSLNIIWWILFVGFFYGIARKKIGHDYAILLSIFFLSSPFFFTFKHNVLSDIPFLAFLTASMFCFMQYINAKNKKKSKYADAYFIAALLTCSFSFLIRYIAFVMFLSIFIFLLCIEKSYRKVFYTLIAFGLAVWIIKFIGASPVSYFREASFPLMYWIKSGYLNIFYTFRLLVIILIPELFIFCNSTTILMMNIINFFAIAIFLCVIFLFIKKLLRRKIDHLDLFYLLYFMSLICWPIIDGIRYVMPIMALTMLFLVKNFHLLIEKIHSILPNSTKFLKLKIVKSLLIVLIFINVTKIIFIYRFDDNQINNPQTIEMVDWVKTNLNDDDVFMFLKPRVLSLFTQKKGATPKFFDQRDPFLKHIQKYRITYFVEALHHPLHISIEPYRDWIDYKQVWKNEGYIIYRINAVKSPDSF